MKATATAGPLVIIGGAEDKQGECAILREVTRLAGGPKARVVVMTVASDFPGEVGEEYTEVFQRLDARQVRALDVRYRDQACEPGLVRAIEEATGVFFTGGDQFRITNLLGGSATDQALRRRHEGGMVLAGTSAGASMMSSTMIVRGCRRPPPGWAT